MGRYYLRGCLGTVAAREPNPSLVRSLPQRICGERDVTVHRVLMVEPLACHCRGESCHGTRGSADLFRRTVVQKAGAPSDDITSWFTNRCLDQNTVDSLSVAGIPRNILQHNVIYAYRPNRIWTTSSPAAGISSRRLVPRDGWAIAASASIRATGKGSILTPRHRPARRALLDEGLYTLECTRVHHVAGHRRTGVLVGGYDALLELAIEQCLAERDRDARLRDDAGDQRLDLVIERVGRRDAID